jgi:hypothetical protein
MKVIDTGLHRPKINNSAKKKFFNYNLITKNEEKLNKFGGKSVLHIFFIPIYIIYRNLYIDPMFTIFYIGSIHEIFLCRIFIGTNCLCTHGHASMIPPICFAQFFLFKISYFCNEISSKIHVHVLSCRILSHLTLPFSLFCQVLFHFNVRYTHLLFNDDFRHGFVSFFVTFICLQYFSVLMSCQFYSFSSRIEQTTSSWADDIIYSHFLPN